MKKEVFDKMLNSGEFEQLFNENKINDLLRDGNLSKEQIDKLVDLGKKMSKDEILRRQRDLAKQPGYKEHVLTPLIKKIIAQQGRARDPITGRYIKQETPNQQKAEEQPQEQPQQENPNADRTAERAEQMGQKFKPKRMKNMFSGSRGTTAKPATSKVNTELYSKIGQVQNPRLLKGDNAATVASKLYSIMKNDINEYNVRSKLERKRDKQYLDSEVKRHNEIIAALNRAGGGAGGGSKRTQTGMGIGAKLAIGAGLLGAAALARASEKPTPDVLPPEPKIDPPVPAPSPAPAPAPVPPKVNVEEETRKRQQEAEREAAAQQEKQNREQERQQREAEQKQKEAEQKKAAEDKKKEQEEKKKAEEKQKAAAAEEARKQKEQEDEDKEKAAEAKAKAAREEKARKALEAEEKRKKDVAERIAKAQAEGQKREAERLRKEEEKTAREEAARIKKEREDAEKEADAQKRESALRLKKQAEAISAEIERQKSQKDDYQPPRNGPRELPYDESIGRRYPTPIVTPAPRELPYDESIGRRYPTPIVTPAPPVVTPVPRPRPPRTLTPVQEPEPAPPLVTPVPAPFLQPPKSKKLGSDITFTAIHRAVFKGEQGITTVRDAFRLEDNENHSKIHGVPIGVPLMAAATSDTFNTTSYGVFGINNKRWNKLKNGEWVQGSSSMDAFLRFNPGLGLPDPGDEKDPTSVKKFNEAWWKLAKEDPEKLLKAQLNYFEKGYENPSRVKLKAFKESKKINEYIQNNEGVVLFLTDRRVQYGTALLESSMNYASKAKTPQEFIELMAEYDEKNLRNIFESQSDSWFVKNKRGLTNRINIRSKAAEEASSGFLINDMSTNNKELKRLRGMDKPIVIINNGTTVVGSTNRSGLSIPTSPDNSAYYPYAA